VVALPIELVGVVAEGGDLVGLGGEGLNSLGQLGRVAGGQVKAAVVLAEQLIQVGAGGGEGENGPTGGQHAVEFAGGYDLLGAGHQADQGEVAGGEGMGQLVAGLEGQQQ